MTQQSDRAGAIKQPRSPTIGGLMSLIFIVGIFLFYSTRLGASAYLPFCILVVVIFPGSHLSGFSQMAPLEFVRPALPAIRPAIRRNPRSGCRECRGDFASDGILGFRNLGHFRVSNSVADGGVYATLFENRQSRQYAKLWTAIVGGGPVRRAETTLAFFTEFSDGPTLVTGNNRTRPLTPRVREKYSMSFPSVRDPRRLYEIHTAILDRFGTDANRLETAIEDPADFLRKSHSERASQVFRIRLLLSRRGARGLPSDVERSHLLELEIALAGQANPAMLALEERAVAARTRLGANVTIARLDQSQRQRAPAAAIKASAASGPQLPAT